ncbi:7855_t:CDS:2, partial [Entrophospora sp. SA101]
SKLELAWQENRCVVFSGNVLWRISSLHEYNVPGMFDGICFTK